MANSTTNAELQPCPFCGCPAYQLTTFTNNKNPSTHSQKFIPAVRCANVLCAVELSDTADKTAIEKWNSRAVSVARSAVSSVTTSSKNETIGYSHGYRI